jgi:hypothetical protein
LRRSLGFELNDLERQVGLFCTWLQARGQTTTFTIVVPPKSWRVSYAASGLVLDSLIS